MGRLTLVFAGQPIELQPVRVIRIDRDAASGENLIAVDYSTLPREVRSELIEYVIGRLRDV
jgi:hypothetical protein